tara:strand:+ start:10606 stop:11634 length:1029 start_codon:yes stop_codon:yes gene_type:complete
MRFPQNIPKNEFETILTQINEHRSTKQMKPLKMASVAQYCANYNILSKLCEYDPESPDYFLEDYDTIMTGLDQPNQRTKKPLTDNSKRNYLNGVIVLLQTLGAESEIIMKFINTRDSLNEKYNEIKEKSEYTDEEKESLVTHEQIDQMLSKIKKELIGLDAWTPREGLSDKTFNLLQFYTMMSLYRQHHLRNDFASLNVIRKREYNKLGDDMKANTNFLLLENKGFTIVLNDFKTNKEGKTTEIAITDKPTLTLLRKYIKVIGASGGMPLFAFHDCQMSSNQLTCFLQKYTKEYLGKKLGTRMLRKIFYTEKYGGLIEELKNDAKENLHSTGVAMDIYTQKS